MIPSLRNLKIEVPWKVKEQDARRLAEDFGSSNISTSLERRKRPSDNVSGSPEWEQRRSSVDSEAMGALAMDPPPLSE